MSQEVVSHGLLGIGMPLVSREVKSGLEDDEIFLEVLKDVCHIPTAVAVAG